MQIVVARTDFCTDHFANWQGLLPSVGDAFLSSSVRALTIPRSAFALQVLMYVELRHNHVTNLSRRNSAIFVAVPSHIRVTRVTRNRLRQHWSGTCYIRAPHCLLRSVIFGMVQGARAAHAASFSPRRALSYDICQHALFFYVLHIRSPRIHYI